MLNDNESAIHRKALKYAIPIGTPRRIIKNGVKQWMLLEKVTSEEEFSLWIF